MKKRILKVLILIIFFLPFVSLYAQDIEVIREDSVIYGSLGQELVVYAKIVNVSQEDQIIFLVRTEENLPNNWSSSLCFGILCFTSNLDSVATSEDFGLQPVRSGDTIEASVHFQTDSTLPGTGYVQIQIGSVNSPNVRTIINEMASTEPNAADDQVNALSNFRLMQNYPNPFNPSTTISFTLPERSNITLKVYNITGKEIKTLINEEKEAGIYNINFDGEKLSSGIYFYEITAGKYSAVRKMILLK
ncbi:MAG TPA: T9SS type A sorting domain-containing protein [Ignavibacteriaceae bacterium]|nr:T9SS type A sorting domain-containing protein [Ignavibacteriaceae bacterium]